MSREISYRGIILKKQAYREADEIITIYTKDLGKLRLLAKSVKLPKSKLSAFLQPFFEVDITVSRFSSLPKVIRVQPISFHRGLHENSETVSVGVIATEIILRSTPDEQKNENLYKAYSDFLNFLDSAISTTMALGLLKFKILALEALGLGVVKPGIKHAKDIYFSNNAGFTLQNAATVFKVDGEVLRHYFDLSETDFKDLETLGFDSKVLDKLITEFLTYQIEREIKSEKFLKT